MSRLRCVVAGGAVFVVLATALMASVVGREVNGSVVILTSGDARPYREVVEGVRGYLGQHRPSATVDVYALSEGDHAHVVDQIRRAHPSVLITLGSQAVDLALEEVPDVPIVATLVLDLAHVRAARNATGVSLEFSPETSLTWLTRILPGRDAVGVLYDPGLNQQVVDAAGPFAAGLDLTLHGEAVRTPRDLRVAMEQLERRADVLWGIPDRTVFSAQTAEKVLLFSFRKRLPFVGLSAEWVKAGAIYALERDYRDVGKQCGELVVKILGGTPPHALLPQTPRTVVYDVNLRTAKQLRITLSDEILAGAREVIQ